MASEQTSVVYFPVRSIFRPYLLIQWVALEPHRTPEGDVGLLAVQDGGAVHDPQAWRQYRHSLHRDGWVIQAINNTKY